MLAKRLQDAKMRQIISIMPTMSDNMMDELDRKLLALLRANARETAVILARKLKVSRGTVQNRIARMVAERQIHGFTFAPRLTLRKIGSGRSCASPLKANSPRKSFAPCVVYRSRGYPHHQWALGPCRRAGHRHFDGIQPGAGSDPDDRGHSGDGNLPAACQRQMKDRFARRSVTRTKQPCRPARKAPRRNRSETLRWGLGG